MTMLWLILPLGFINLWLFVHTPNAAQNYLTILNNAMPIIAGNNSTDLTNISLFEWQRLKTIDVKNLIFSASPTDGSDRLISHSIGFNWRIIPAIYYDILSMTQEEYATQCKTNIDLMYHKFEEIFLPQRIRYNHSLLIFSSYSINTDYQRQDRKQINREIISNTLKNGALKLENVRVDDKIYYESLSKYKFSISPEGNGIDCHRHYESLIYGAIPIIENQHKDIIITKYGNNVPILWTDDYSELNQSYLIEMYDKMLFEKYDYSQLFKTFYHEKTQKNIFESCNYWLNLRKGMNLCWYCTI